MSCMASRRVRKRISGLRGDRSPRRVGAEPAEMEHRHDHRAQLQRGADVIRDAEAPVAARRVGDAAQQQRADDRREHRVHVGQLSGAVGVPRHWRGNRPNP